MPIKDGDRVTIGFRYDVGFVTGVLVNHFADAQGEIVNATIRTDKGGLMSGPVATIYPTEEQQAAVYPEAKHDK
jgi:hypothetical protein